MNLNLESNQELIQSLPIKFTFLQPLLLNFMADFYY